MKLNQNHFIVHVMIGCVLLLVACSKSSGESATRNPVDSTQQPAIKYIDTFASKPFVHEGLLVTQADFDRIKMKVNAGIEPWISGWNKLIANSHAQLTYVPSPVDTLIRGGNSREEPLPDNYSHAYHDVAAAFQLAIRWKVTGDNAYADKAIQILNAWASVCKAIRGNSNLQLAAGIYGYQFANAAEIMRTYEGWDASDFKKFQNWMYEIWYPINKDFLVRHNNTCISHYWANWDLCNIASEMAIGVLTDKRQLYNDAVWYFQHGEGNGNIFKTINQVYGDSLAQLQESGRDQGHTTLDIALLDVIIQQAWNQGDDFFAFDDNRFLKACEYAARYNVAKLSVPYTAYNNCDNVNQTLISEGGRGDVRPMWELPFNHYVKLKGLRAPYTEMAAGSVRPEGGGGDYGPNSGGYDQLGLGTLLFTLEQ
jgi:hypothetical protein